jgi:hypothetical protein
MSCSTFEHEGGRKAMYAKDTRAFWFDLDCGAEKAAEGKGYLTKKEAAATLAEFCQKTGLPTPTVIDSGNGLHVYWFLDGPLAAAEWKRIAEKLKDLTRSHGLLADDACTADAARVLRVPGTLNYKDPARPKPVTIKRIVPPAPTDEFIAAIEKAHGAIVPGQQVAIPVYLAEVPAYMRGRIGNLAALCSNPETSEAITRLQSALSSIPPDCDRATWRNVVWSILAHGWSCGVDIARDWSMDGIKYDESDFLRVVQDFRS